MNLQIDVGNTRLKWRLVDDAADQATNVGGIEDFRSFIASDSFSASNLGNVYISSVANRRQVDSIKALLKDVGCNAVVHELVSVEHMGALRLTYEQPDTMGVDRALAMLAAFHEIQVASLGYAGVLVLDAGTALTADYVNQDGVHCDGYICAGLQMMRASLLNQTGDIHRGFDLGETASGKLSTLYCVEQGVKHAFVSTIKAFVARARAENYFVLVTGGDAGFIQQALDDEGLGYRQDLVLDGISLFISNQSI